MLTTNEYELKPQPTGKITIDHIEYDACISCGAVIGQGGKPRHCVNCEHTSNVMGYYNLSDEQWDALPTLVQQTLITEHSTTQLVAALRMTQKFLATLPTTYLETEKQNRRAINSIIHNALIRAEKGEADSVADVLKDYFPWLGTDDEANGADTVDQLAELYGKLRRGAGEPTEQQVKAGLWENDAIQFPRLLAEIEAAGCLDTDDLNTLCDSMDLSADDISGLFDRAQTAWEISKNNSVPPSETTE